MKVYLNEDNKTMVEVDDDVMETAKQVVAMESICIEWSASAQRSWELAAVEIQKLVTQRVAEARLDELRRMARSVFLKVEEGQNGTTGNYWATTSTYDDWPGDFYGGSEAKNRGKRSFTCVGSLVPVDALSISIRMALTSLERNAHAWRGIVRRMPEYKDWF